jgi:N-formylglutamate deformylase
MTPVNVLQGTSPVVLGLPHTGTFLPPAVKLNLNNRGRELTDTDWHIERLYGDLLPGVTTVRAMFHRYVIDANRDPGGETLYPGQNSTSLVPLTDFDGQNIWDSPPDEQEIGRRKILYHAPYHAALKNEMERVHALHGVVILHDCHSIRSHIPFLFDGRLPDFNIGTNSGTACAPVLQDAMHKICGNAAGYSAVVNGRFKGGWTTRHYGWPGRNWHAVQMELAQSTYLTTEMAPWTYDAAKAGHLRFHLLNILQTLSSLALRLGKVT